MITNLNEYKKFQQDEMLVELAKINKGELSFDVCVFGVSSYSDGSKSYWRKTYTANFIAVKIF